MKNKNAITDIDDKRISLYRSLKGKALKEDGVFIAEGEKVVRALLKSDIEIVSALMSESWFKKLHRQFKKKTPIYIATHKDTFEKIVGFKLHQGLMVCAKIPDRLSLEEAIKPLSTPHLLLALDGIKDPENIGMILRNCLAFGVDAVIVGKNSSDPYLRRSVRVSIGTIFKIPVVYVNNLSVALKTLRGKYKTRIIAASPSKKAKVIDKENFSGNICLVLGDEVHGISSGALKFTDSVAKIPIANGVDSINVACASSIFLYMASASRQPL